MFIINWFESNGYIIGKSVNNNFIKVYFNDFGYIKEPRYNCEMVMSTTLVNSQKRPYFKTDGKETIEKVSKITRFLTYYDITFCCYVEYDIINFPLVKNLRRKSSEEPPPKLSLLAYDIEVYSSNNYRMPNASIPEDKIVLIVMIMDEKIITLNNSNELDLIKDFFSNLEYLQPDIITGYNNLGFDNMYIYERANFLNLAPSLKSYSISWYSNAFGYNDYVFISKFINFDVMQFIRKEYKLPKYSLNFVSKEYLNEEKLDVDIFQLIRDNNLERLTQYCIQDTKLVLKLIDKLDIITTLVEMSSIFNISIQDLYTRGQKHKLTPIIYRKCFNRNIIYETMQGDTYNYKGATVISPDKGIYNNCSIIDFASLYPSILIAYNICYYTHTKEKENSYEITLENSDKIYFKKDVPGILPEITQELIATRKKYKKNFIKQWCYKIAANSIYGLIARDFVQGAASITSIGRHSINRAISYIQENLNRRVIYGDTDSCIIDFSDTNVNEIKDKTINLAKEVSKLFKEPMSLEFENIYTKLFIFSKKRYIAYKEDNSIIYKGIVMKRRDNCNYLKKTYQGILDLINEGRSRDHIKRYVTNRLLKIYQGEVKEKDLYIYTSIGEEYTSESNPQNILKNKYNLTKGDRVEYLLCHNDNNLQGHKMFLSSDKNHPEIDYLYYIEKKFINPLSEVLELVHLENLPKTIYENLILNKMV